ncbi:hypothetical protein PsalN5692_03570 (plasmid) [Piscirickettsia salmonis]|nr:hypothetical protein PsalN5692_03570 [Piscirickettsia salmonis]
MKFECPITLDELSPREVQIYAVKSQKNEDKNSSIYSIYGIARASFIMLNCCPITRATIYFPLTLQEYLSITEGDNLDTNAKVISEEIFKEKFHNKMEVSFLKHDKYIKYLAKALDMLREAGEDSEENWQLIENPPEHLKNHRKHLVQLIIALGDLKKHGLFNEKNQQLLINKAEHALKLTKALTELQKAKLANQNNWQLLIHQAEHALRLADALSVLRRVGLANEKNWQLLAKHPQHAYHLKNILYALNKQKLISEENWQLIVGQAEYAESLNQTFSILLITNLANKKNYQLLIKQIKYAPYLAYSLDKLRIANLANQNNLLLLTNHAEQAIDLANGLILPKIAKPYIQPIIVIHYLKIIINSLNQDRYINFSHDVTLKNVCFAVSACQNNVLEYLNQLTQFLNNSKYYLLKKEICQNGEIVRKRDIRNFAIFGKKSESGYFLNSQDFENRKYFLKLKNEEATLLFERGQEGIVAKNLDVEL